MILLVAFVAVAVLAYLTGWATGRRDRRLTVADADQAAYDRLEAAPVRQPDPARAPGEGWEKCLTDLEVAEVCADLEARADAFIARLPELAGAR